MRDKRRPRRGLMCSNHQPKAGAIECGFPFLLLLPIGSKTCRFTLSSVPLAAGCRVTTPKAGGIGCGRNTHNETDPDETVRSFRKWQDKRKRW